MAGGNLETHSLTVIAPVYCEEEVIETFYERLKETLTSLPSRFTHDIILVNDGSTDHTLEALSRIASADDSVTVIDLSRNFGHQIAITAGLDFAQGDAVVVMDSDLQDPPEFIPSLLEKWEEGFKVVYGIRSRRKGEGTLKRTSAAAFYRLFQRLSDTKAPVDAGDFRLLDKSVVLALRRIRERNRYMRGLIHWVGFTQCGISYERDARYAGQTKYTLPKMIRLALDGIAGFSEKPLSFVSYFGTLVTAISLLVIAWLIYQKVRHPQLLIQGWTSLLVVILFLGGVQLMSIGILGQYIARIFKETKQRPLYLISNILHTGSPHAPGAHAQPYGTDR